MNQRNRYVVIGTIILVTVTAGGLAHVYATGSSAHPSLSISAPDPAASRSTQPKFQIDVSISKTQFTPPEDLFATATTAEETTSETVGGILVGALGVVAVNIISGSLLFKLYPSRHRSPCK